MTLRVAADRIISVAEARTRLSELVEDVAADAFWVLTKGGKPRAAVVDVDYLDRLIRRAWFNDLAQQSQSAFDAYLRVQGVESDMLDENQAKTLIGKEE